ncbi:MAG: SDR family NAD(P)-dependent oxidoreductase [Actinobacteria bacterium]|nr:SDR family NAD(P)-dependent oxidoreductase [Actinomycetota bacterium]
MSLRGALVTGGTRGIGFATALELARRDFHVVIVGSSEESIQSAKSKALSSGVTLDGHACDITDPAAVTTLRDQLAGVSEIEVLVNSAGVMSERTAKTLRATAVEWRRVLAINLDAPFYFMNTFVPAMVERREGRVINVTACLGRFSGPGNTGGLAPYRISKSGLNALTKNLAHELGTGSRGVFVDAVCPGHCRTDMGGPDAPRSAEEGADTIVWLATRPKEEAAKQTGLLWEDRQVVPW